MYRFLLHDETRIVTVSVPGLVDRLIALHEHDQTLQVRALASDCINVIAVRRPRSRSFVLGLLNPLPGQCDVSAVVRDKVRDGAFDARNAPWLQAVAKGPPESTAKPRFQDDRVR